MANIRKQTKSKGWQKQNQKRWKREFAAGIFQLYKKPEPNLVHQAPSITKLLHEVTLQYVSNVT